MRPSLYPILLSLLLSPLGAQVQADGPAATAEEHRKAAALVRQLGDRSFRLRQAASRQLRKMRLAALKAVEEGTLDKDPEIRRHCSQLLPELLRADLFERIDALVADKEGKKKHNLPGWTLFQELAGADAPARQLFAEVSRREPELLETLEKNPARAAALCDARCQQLAPNLYNGSVALLPADLTPFFLVGADKRVKTANTFADFLCAAIQRPGPREALTAKPPGSAFRKLVLAWMQRQTQDHPLGQVLQAATNLNLPEAAGLALRVARQKNGTASARGQALVMLGKVGGKEHVPLLESLLDEKGVVAGFGIGGAGGGWRGTTELRDVALAMLVHLTGQKHADYNFTYTRSGQSFLFNAPFLGFSSNEERDAALKKWHTWKAAQKKKK